MALGKRTWLIFIRIRFGSAKCLLQSLSPKSCRLRREWVVGNTFSLTFEGLPTQISWDIQTKYKIQVKSQVGPNQVLEF